MIIFDAYYWSIDDNLEQLVLDIFHDGFFVNDKPNYIIGVVLIIDKDAYFSFNNVWNMINGWDDNKWIICIGFPDGGDRETSLYVDYVDVVPSIY